MSKLYKIKEYSRDSGLALVWIVVVPIPIYLRTPLSLSSSSTSSSYTLEIQIVWRSCQSSVLSQASNSNIIINKHTHTLTEIKQSLSQSKRRDLIYPSSHSWNNHTSSHTVLSSAHTHAGQRCGKFLTRAFCSVYRPKRSQLVPRHTFCFT